MKEAGRIRGEIGKLEFHGSDGKIQIMCHSQEKELVMTDIYIFPLKKLLFTKLICVLGINILMF
jgi:hypothetical protein